MNLMNSQNIWLGRLSRRMYWLAVLAWLAIYIPLFLVSRGSFLVQSLSFAIWLYIAGRRLYDFNASPLWALTVAAIGFVLGIVERSGAVFVGATLLHKYSQDIIALASLAQVLVVGAIPGEAGKNQHRPGEARKGRGPSSAPTVIGG
jgi:uncharacterized membrane protein YhaH (DUF805 family)